MLSVGKMVSENDAEQMRRLNAEIEETYREYAKNKSHQGWKMRLAYLYFVRAHRYAKYDMHHLAAWDMRRFDHLTDSKYLALYILDWYIWLIRSSEFHIIAELLSKYYHAADSIRTKPWLTSIALLKNEAKMMENLRGSEAYGMNWFKSLKDRMLRAVDLFWLEGGGKQPRMQIDDPRKHLIGAKIVRDESYGGGRKIIATQSISKGAEISLEPAACWVNDHIPRMCDLCGKSGPVTGCPKCKLEHFCSQACYKKAWETFHKALCGKTIVTKYYRECAMFKGGFSNIPIVMMRAVAETIQQGYESLIDVSYLRHLSCSRVRYEPAIMKAAYSLCDAFDCLENPAFDLWTFLVASALMKNNSYGDDHSFQIYTAQSMANHSCKPNAAAIDDSLIAKRRIKSGEEILIDYYDERYPAGVKKNRQIQITYGFKCNCELCAAVDTVNVLGKPCPKYDPWTVEVLQDAPKHIRQLITPQ